MLQEWGKTDSDNLFYCNVQMKKLTLCLRKFKKLIVYISCYPGNREIVHDMEQIPIEHMNLKKIINKIGVSKKVTTDICYLTKPRVSDRKKIFLLYLDKSERKIAFINFVDIVLIQGFKVKTYIEINLSNVIEQVNINKSSIFKFCIRSGGRDACLQFIFQ